MNDNQSITVQVPLDIIRVEPPKPLAVTQRTSLDVLGLTKRQFLDMLPEYRASGGEVIRRGRVRMVVLEDFVAWLRSSNRTQANDAIEVGGEPTLADELGVKVG